MTSYAYSIWTFCNFPSRVRGRYRMGFSRHRKWFSIQMIYTNLNAPLLWGRGIMIRAPENSHLFMKQITNIYYYIILN